MIKIEPYDPTWPDQFKEIGQQLRAALGTKVFKIHHIGSTAVPDLPAKDVIDIQATVSSLSDELLASIKELGYVHCDWITQDHVPPGGPPELPNWQKWVFKEPKGMRRVNFHVRVSGKPNQRYPLLCRDYLRTHPGVAAAYAKAKEALAKLHPDDADAYYSVKDPIFDIIMGGAEVWAKATHWTEPPSDC